MADLYANYAELAAATVEGVDYSRSAVTLPGAAWSSIAVHGGGIEAGSGEMAVAAGATIASTYVFAGLRNSGNGELHVTSTNFDEPLAEALVTATQHTLSFHGYTGTDGVPETAMGGLDLPRIASITEKLQNAGFAVVPAPPELAGSQPDNICNRNTSSAGVQLEMSRAQRQAFFPGGDTSRAMRESGQRTAAFYDYANVMRSEILEGVPMAIITPDRSDPLGNSTTGTTTGETPTPYTPAAAGDSIALIGDKVTLVFVTSTSNTPTVTVDSVRASDQGNDNNLTMALPATGIRRMTFDASDDRFKQVSGNVGHVNLTYSVTPTGTTMYAWYTS